MKPLYRIIAVLGVLLILIVATFPGAARHRLKDTAVGALGDTRGLKDTVVLIVRHAEKPFLGRGLTAAGELRAQAYATYFQNYKAGDQNLRLDYLFASGDSSNSQRPRLTLEPLGKALHLPIDCRFKDRDFQGLANMLRGRRHGNAVLIAWHHGRIPQLLQALDADPAKLLPNGKWPGGEYGWVLELRYDHDGKLAESRRVEENLALKTEHAFSGAP